MIYGIAFSNLHVRMQCRVAAIQNCHKKHGDRKPSNDAHSTLLMSLISPLVQHSIIQAPYFLLDPTHKTKPIRTTIAPCSREVTHQHSVPRMIDIDGGLPGYSYSYSLASHAMSLLLHAFSPATSVNIIITCLIFVDI